MIKLKPAPKLTTGACLLFWGWQNEFLIYALPMALLLESAHWAAWRWPISDKEFNAIADLSGVIFFLLVIYIFNEKGTQGIFTTLSITPFVLFPLILIQSYSEQGKIKLSALFISLRRLDGHDALEFNAGVDLTLPYCLVSIISASAGNRHMIWFFIFACILISIILWSLRPKRYSLGLWGGLLFLSFILAYSGQAGIKQAHQMVELMVMDIFDQFAWRYRDPDRANTAIGTIGRLKLSDRIIIRVKTGKELDRPLLLQEAIYTNYGYGIWSNMNSEFDLIDPEPTGNSWILSDISPRDEVTISTFMPKENAVVPVPHGTARIHDITAFQLEINPYGTVRMETREGWIQYKASYMEQQLRYSPPQNPDIYIDGNYRNDFNRLAQELNLNTLTPEAAVQTVEDYFTRNFFYSLTREVMYPRGRHLHNFLFKTKKGHCEYFATATVLLLRAAGIPARYVTGYLVDEYSLLEGNYIVRARHAHSWTMAYFDNNWHIIDTTPSIWAPLEAENTSLLRPVIDFFSWARYKFLRWQSSDDLEEENPSYDYLLFLLIPLVTLLIWRLYFKKRVARPKKEESSALQRLYAGKDSELYSLIAMLEKTGYPRRNGETLMNWFKRINIVTDAGNTGKALHLHYRYRFDPDDDGNKTKSEIIKLIRPIMIAGGITPSPDKT